jgi:hypothetical protein
MFAGLSVILFQTCSVLDGNSSPISLSSECKPEPGYRIGALEKEDASKKLSLEENYVLGNYHGFCCFVVVGSGKWHRRFIYSRAAYDCGTSIDLQPAQSGRRIVG